MAVASVGRNVAANLGEPGSVASEARWERRPEDLTGSG